MFSWKRALPQETTASTDTPANSLKPSSVNGTSAARVLLIRKDRKSTRLNSSHSQISYAVFCLKKKKKTQLEFDPKQYPTHQPQRTPPRDRLQLLPHPHHVARHTSTHHYRQCPGLSAVRRCDSA